MRYGPRALGACARRGERVVIPEAVAEGLPAKWVISDTHWTQPDLEIVFNRPTNWSRLTVKAWKAAVGAEDTILHLGDVAGSSVRKDLLRLLAELPGKVILVPGNWDSEVHLAAFRELGWQLKRGLLIRPHRGWKVIFTHEPLDADELERRKALWVGVLNVHGHLHGWPDQSPYHINVSLERLDYQPRILADIVDARIDELLEVDR